jgi:hypothetical protein
MNILSSLAENKPAHRYLARLPDDSQMAYLHCSREGLGELYRWERDDRF